MGKGGPAGWTIFEKGEIMTERKTQIKEQCDYRMDVVSARLASLEKEARQVKCKHFRIVLSVEGDGYLGQAHCECCGKKVGNGTWAFKKLIKKIYSSLDR